MGGIVWGSDVTGSCSDDVVVVVDDYHSVNHLTRADFTLTFCLMSASAVSPAGSC